jgi:Fe-S-cluster containining protein
MIMHFFNELFGIECDTASMKNKRILKKLNRYYEKIPATVCNFCPTKLSVEADCCKHFSPPMYLAEFISALKIIEKWSKDDKMDLLSACFESFINPDIVRPCPLLGSDNKCQIYSARPFSCRMYGQYPKSEWEKRLKQVSKDWEVSEDEIPMKDQCGCPNVDFLKKNIKPLTVEEENNIFQGITDLDIETVKENALLKSIDGNFERDIVYGGKTYMPFDTHYLLMFVGPDNLEKLADMRSILFEKKKQLKAGEIQEQDLVDARNQVEDFLSLMKNNIINL